MIKITEAPIAHEPIVLKRDHDVEKFKQKFEALVDPYPDMFKMDLFDKLGLWIQNGAKYSKVIFIFINLITKLGGTMATSNDTKTTRTSIIKVIITSLVSVVTLFFGLDIPAETQAQFLGAVVGIWGIVDWVQGYLTNKPDQIPQGK